MLIYVCPKAVTDTKYSLYYPLLVKTYLYNLGFLYFISLLGGVTGNSGGAGQGKEEGWERELGNDTYFGKLSKLDKKNSVNIQW